MPMYEYKCQDEGHVFSLFASIKNHSRVEMCRECGGYAEQIISAPLMVTAQQECRYDSPITGEPITSWAARRNDLAKHDCVPYDPEQKKDFLRRQKESQEAVDKAIDTTVEAAIEKMPTAKRGKLYNELTRAGADVVVERASPNA